MLHIIKTVFNYFFFKEINSFKTFLKNSQKYFQDTKTLKIEKAPSSTTTQKIA